MGPLIFISGNGHAASLPTQLGLASMGPLIFISGNGASLDGASLVGALQWGR